MALSCYHIIRSDLLGANNTVKRSGRVTSSNINLFILSFKAEVDDGSRNSDDFLDTDIDRRDLVYHSSFQSSRDGSIERAIAIWCHIFPSREIFLRLAFRKKESDPRFKD